MTMSIGYRTCRSCHKVIQKPVTLVSKFPQLFKLPEPQPDPYPWTTADAAQATSCDAGGPPGAHTPATPSECVTDDSGQCVNYAADHATAPNLHACPVGGGGARPGAGPGRARTRAAGRKRAIRDWSYLGDARN
jgi:hypothetical protein